jgi:hypothetical protein
MLSNSFSKTPCRIKRNNDVPSQPGSVHGTNPKAQRQLRGTETARFETMH